MKFADDRLEIAGRSLSAPLAAGGNLRLHEDVEALTHTDLCEVAKDTDLAARLPGYERLATEWLFIAVSGILQQAWIAQFPAGKFPYGEDKRESMSRFHDEGMDRLRAMIERETNQKEERKTMAKKERTAKAKAAKPEPKDYVVTVYSVHTAKFEVEKYKKLLDKDNNQWAAVIARALKNGPLSFDQLMDEVKAAYKGKSEETLVNNCRWYLTNPKSLLVKGGIIKSSTTKSEATSAEEARAEVQA